MVGKPRETLKDRAAAYRVWEKVGAIRHLSELGYGHLLEISVAPEWAWPGLASAAAGLTRKETAALVAHAAGRRQSGRWKRGTIDTQGRKTSGGSAGGFRPARSSSTAALTAVMRGRMSGRSPGTFDQVSGGDELGGQFTRFGDRPPVPRFLGAENPRR